MANGIKRGPLYAVCQEYQRHGIAAPGPTTNLPIPGRSAPDKASNTVTISNHFDRRQPEEEFRCTAVVRGPVGFRGLIGAKQRDCSNPRPTASAVRFGTQTRGHDKRMNDRYGARDAGSAEHSRPESAGSGRGWARVIWAWARGGALGGWASPCIATTRPVHKTASSATGRPPNHQFAYTDSVFKADQNEQAPS